MRTIELLAPAKNLECGIAAIDHGADAVYIGASRFGARQSAGNSVEDIGKLCEYAHRYGVTVHVTINTIIYDEEFEETLALVRELVNVGVDAFLLQDMGFLPCTCVTLCTGVESYRIRHYLPHLTHQSHVLQKEGINASSKTFSSLIISIKKK